MQQQSIVIAEGKILEIRPGCFNSESVKGEVHIIDLGGDTESGFPLRDAIAFVMETGRVVK